jgi:radical SAM protein with 4Fe4S-binding SPASM domain
LNDIDFSLDSPFPEEHNQNRQANLYQTVISSLQSAKEAGIDCGIIMCGMNWNMTHRHINAFLQLAREMDCEMRINLLKPTDSEHTELLPTRRQFLEAFAYLTQESDQVVVGEPILAALMEIDSGGCPCGISSFRIHSMTSDGRVPISPCVYLHRYKVGNLLTEDIFDIVSRDEFKMFRSRLKLLPLVCRERDCRFSPICRGGCAARAELVAGDFFAPDPYCPYEELRDAGSLPKYPIKPAVGHKGIRVHENYLCTWIGKPQRLMNTQHT